VPEKTPPQAPLASLLEANPGFNLKTGNVDALLCFNPPKWCGGPTPEAVKAWKVSTAVGNANSNSPEVLPPLDPSPELFEANSLAKVCVG
jgi:hypothetical protein